MTFDELMAGLAEAFGVKSGFNPDEEGIVNIEAEGMVLSFLAQDDYPVAGRTSLILWGRLDGLTDENSDALTEAMLKANDRPNLPGAPALSLLDETICLQQTLFLDELDVPTLARAANDFTRELTDWRDRVLDFVPGTETDEASSAVPAEDAPDAPEIRHLTVDGVELTLHIAATGAVLRCTAGKMPVNGANRFRRAMLHANFMGRDVAGAGLAISAEDEIVIYETLPLALAEGESLEASARGLAAMARQWRHLAGEYPPVAIRREAEESEDRRLARRMIASAFLRV